MNNSTSGMDLKVERIRSRVTGVRLAEAYGCGHANISYIESMPVVPKALLQRYRAALLSVTRRRTTASNHDATAGVFPPSAPAAVVLE